MEYQGFLIGIAGGSRTKIQCSRMHSPVTTARVAGSLRWTGEWCGRKARWGVEWKVYSGGLRMDEEGIRMKAK